MSSNFAGKDTQFFENCTICKIESFLFYQFSNRTVKSSPTRKAKIKHRWDPLKEIVMTEVCI